MNTAITTIDGACSVIMRATAMLKLMANRDRFLLLSHLAHAECDVGQLREALGIEQPTLSQQLGVLRRAALVDTRRAGRHVYYRTTSAEALALVAMIESTYLARRAELT